MLPKGQNFDHKEQKGQKKLDRAGKIRGRIFTRFIKKRPKLGRTFIRFSFSKKSSRLPAKIYINWILYFSRTIFDRESLKKTVKFVSASECYVGAELLCQRPNFLVALAEILSDVNF
jgi:hypothetical protein